MYLYATELIKQIPEGVKLSQRGGPTYPRREPNDPEGGGQNKLTPIFIFADCFPVLAVRAANGNY